MQMQIKYSLHDIHFHIKRDQTSRVQNRALKPRCCCLSVPSRCIKADKLNAGEVMHESKLTRCFHTGATGEMFGRLMSTLDYGLGSPDGEVPAAATEGLEGLATYHVTDCAAGGAGLGAHNAPGSPPPPPPASSRGPSQFWGPGA